MDYEFRNSELSILRTGDVVVVFAFGKGTITITGGKICSDTFNNSEELLKALHTTYLVDKGQQNKGELYGS